ncbi:hypothetical protein ER308_17750 [Egibacter rhizosphaerae]|uniref:Flagellar basal body rod protein FlgB n=1 Tax=Egibacter rhizosphaerae TaxID=1670831 RepID=A0A411YJA1_9ACTN|nr:hypothetical protein [Egibacter rhizosphaerae]QBI21231.1 hypothetical protein ER308_17750 [Egibacter rhizosphaerae]
MEIHDEAMSAAQYALQGLSERADVRSHNVSNINTPGFRAERVDFESSLQSALQRGSPEAAPDPVREASPQMPDGSWNTASLEDEMVGMMKDNLQRDAMVNAYNYKAGIMRTAING